MRRFISILRELSVGALMFWSPELLLVLVLRKAPSPLVLAVLLPICFITASEAMRPVLMKALAIRFVGVIIFGPFAIGLIQTLLGSGFHERGSWLAMLVASATPPFGVFVFSGYDGSILGLGITFFYVLCRPLVPYARQAFRA